MSENILQIENLTCGYWVSNQYEEVLIGADLSIQKGEMVGLMGRSGSGKSTVIMSIIGLLEEIGGERKTGKIKYKKPNGLEIEMTEISEKELEKVRGEEIGTVFQNPALSLNPTVKIGKQLERCCKKTETATILKWVGLEKEENILNLYPHQLSIGMCQRITIGMALGRNPSLLILDEPTASLDGINKRLVLELLKKINQELGTSIFITTHDFEALEYLGCKQYKVQAGKILKNKE